VSLRPEWMQWWMTFCWLHVLIMLHRIGTMHRFGMVDVFCVAVFVWIVVCCVLVGPIELVSCDEWCCHFLWMWFDERLSYCNDCILMLDVEFVYTISCPVFFRLVCILDLFIGVAILWWWELLQEIQTVFTSPFGKVGISLGSVKNRTFCESLGLERVYWLWECVWLKHVQSTNFDTLLWNSYFFPSVFDFAKSTNFHGVVINSYYLGNDGWLAVACEGWRCECDGRCVEKRCTNETNWNRSLFCRHYEKSYLVWFWTVPVFVKMWNDDSSWFLMKSTNFSSPVEESYDLWFHLVDAALEWRNVKRCKVFHLHVKYEFSLLLEKFVFLVCAIFCGTDVFFWLQSLVCCHVVFLRFSSFDR